MTAASTSGSTGSAAAHRDPGVALMIDILHEAGDWSAADEECVRRAAARAYEALRGSVPAELSVVLTGDAQIADLNKAWRDRTGPTNVLSFPAAGMPGAEVAILGDVVLARETIVREAEAQGKSFADHLSHLIIHGVLHLLGHDHEDDAEADAMEALERNILEDLGVADPYDADHPSRES